MPVRHSFFVKNEMELVVYFVMRYNAFMMTKRRKQNSNSINYTRNIGMLILFVLVALFCNGCQNMAPYDMEDYQLEYDKSLYQFGGQLEEMPNLVAVTSYGESEILLYEEWREEQQLHKKIWLFSYLTGEKKLCSEFIQSENTHYQATSDRFEVLHSKPFVLMDTYANKMYIYNEELSDYSTVKFRQKEQILEPCGNSDAFYFMDTRTCKVYKNSLREFENNCREIDYETLCEESELLYKPDYNMSYASVRAMSEDGKKLCLNAQSMIDQKQYDYIYDMETRCYEEIYERLDEYGDIWNSWDYDYGFREIKPSAYPRYSFADYKTGIEYIVKIEPEIVYSHVEIARETLDTSDRMLFYVVDEDQEQIVDVLLWDYQKAEPRTLYKHIEKKPVDFPREIDYGELTRKAEALEEKYAVNIIMGENVVCEFEAYDYLHMTEREQIKNALSEIERAFEIFPDGMCKEMVSEQALGFNIYLCGNLMSKSEENISEAGAFFTHTNGYYHLALNLSSGSVEANFVHEMTHAIDKFFETIGVLEELNQEWSKCNPEGFDYLYSYFEYEDKIENTYADTFEHIDEVYFCDTYSKTFPTEDRSRVFEWFGTSCYEEDPVLESEALKKKAKLLLRYCEKHMECFRMDEEYGLKHRAKELGI